MFQELATLKKTLEEETQVHEVQIADMRHKHSQELGAINEQLDTLKKVRTRKNCQRRCYVVEGNWLQLTSLRVPGFNIYFEL